MRDLFEEIWESVRRNKLRTALTGFAVSWGIFVIIVLLGAGNGLMNAFSRGSEGISTNTMSVYGDVTSKPYDGMKEGRRIILDDRDVQIAGSPEFADHIDDVVASVSTSTKINYGKKHLPGTLYGQFPIHQTIDRIAMRAGRYINEKDIAERRKVVVLPENVAENLLDEREQDDTWDAILGRFVKIGGTAFRVIGVSESNQMIDSYEFFVPYTTVRAIYARGNKIDYLSFTFHGLNSVEANEAFEKELKTAINAHHRAAPDDYRALWISNSFTQDLQTNKGRRALHKALWVIGLFSLLGGIVGVSNIMLITVKERTREFGIRKAIGARPWDITKLILAESVSITAFFGYVGMLLGMLSCQLLDKIVGHTSTTVMGQKIQMLVNPTVGLDVALEATLVLIIAGTVAGLFPARRAAQVRPIEALRAE